MKKLALILLSTIIFASNKKFDEIKEVKPDFESYQKINNSYYRDKNYIYYNGDIQYMVDPDSFEVLNGLYSKDKNGVYIPRNSIKERKTVIYYLSKLDNIDIQTFITYENENEIGKITYDAEDKNNYYLYGSIVKNKKK